MNTPALNPPLTGARQRFFLHACGGPVIPGWHRMESSSVYGARIGMAVCFIRATGLIPALVTEMHLACFGFN